VINHKSNDYFKNHTTFEKIRKGYESYIMYYSLKLLLNFDETQMVQE
jgi:hypothetical protein